MPSVKNANSDHTSTIVTQTNRADNRRSTYRSNNYQEVNDYEEETNKSRNSANMRHHIEEDETYLS